MLDLVGLLAIVTPLAIGAVHIESQLVLAGIAIATAAYVWLRPGAQLPTIRLLGWTALGWLAWSLILLAPWPADILSVIANEAVLTYAEAERLTGQTLSPSLALDRSRAATTFVTLMIYGLVAVTVWGRCLEASPRTTSRSRIPFYVIFAGVASAIVAGVHAALNLNELYGLYTPVASLAGQAIRGPMVNGNHTAALLMLCACVTFGVWIRIRDQRRGMLLALVWAGMVTVIFLSASRANIGLTVAGHGYLLWHIRSSEPTKKKTLRWMVLGSMVFAGVVAIAVGGDTWLRDVTGQASKPGVSEVPEFAARWVTGWHVMWESPFLGQGPGNFGIAAARHTSDWASGYLDRAHNLPLQLASEWGIPFALLLLAVGFAWLFRLLRETRTTPSQHAVAVGLVLVVLQNMVDFSLLIPGVGLVWVITAAWLGASTAPREVARSPLSWPRALVVLACIGVFIPVSGLAAAQNARNADTLIRTEAKGEQWRHTVIEVVGQHPADFHLHTLGSAIAAARGEPQLAHALAQRALSFAPLAPTALAVGARAAFETGDIEHGQRNLGLLCENEYPIWRQMCLEILLSQRQHPRTIEAILERSVELTLDLAEHLRQKGHREASTRTLIWGRQTFADQLSIQEALVEMWLRNPKAAVALDDISVDMLARSADEPDPEVKRRLQRLGYLAQARLSERNKRYIEARHLYQEAARLDPEHASEPLLHAGRILLRLKDDEHLDEVLNDLKSVLSPRDTLTRVAYHRLKSQALQRRGRLRKATRELHQAIRLRPRDATLYDALVTILRALGDNRGAERAQAKAAELR